MKVEYTSINEMERVVERYIFEHKNVIVHIDIQTYANHFGFARGNVLKDQLYKLNLAYNVANKFFNDQKKTF